MKFNKNFSFISISYLATLLIFITFGTALAGDSPINIEANHMTSTEKSNSVIFTGEVDATQADVRIRSDKMTVYYTPKEAEPKKKTKGETGGTQQVEKMICIGNVEVTRAEWLGTSKKMVYLSKERQVILTGNAKAWQGQNMVTGEKIIYFLDEGRSEVIGERTSTTVGNNEDPKKKPSRVNMTILQN